MIRRTPRSTRTDTLFPYTTLFRSVGEKRMGTFLAGTNFYGAMKTGYHELGLFGTEACVMVEHRVHGAVCHALTAGEYWIALSDALVADTLYRRCPMTARQAVQSFGNAVSDQVRARSEERRGGEECVSTGRSRWSAYH